MLLHQLHLSLRYALEDISDGHLARDPPMLLFVMVDL